MAGNPIGRAAVEAALGAVTTPEGTDLMASGRLRSLVVDEVEGRVGFAIASTAPEREAMEQVRQAAEQKVKALPGVGKVLAALVAESDPHRGPTPPPPQKEPPARPGLFEKVRRLAGGAAGGEASPQPSPQPSRGRASPGARSEGARPSTPAAPRAPAPGAAGRTGPVEGIQRIVAVGAGKGGVGKSTVSLNLAVALAAAGWRVGLLDADVYGPSVPTLVGAQKHAPAHPDGGFAPFIAHGICAMSIGFLVEPSKAMIWRGPMVTGALAQLLRDTKWGTLDCLIVDMPPGTGDIALSLAQQTPLSGAVIVTTPQDLALIDVRKAAAMFAAVKVPLLGMVENMSGFVCPHCGEATNIFGAGGGAREAAATGVPFLGTIPLAMAVREASDDGKPVALSDDPLGEAYRNIAAALMATLSEDTQQAFPAIIFE